jgi:hypothetical protein
MEINSAFANAVNGIQRGMQGLERNADEVAKASKGDGANIVEPLVESRINSLQAEASARMIKTVDESIGSLLDELA